MKITAIKKQVKNPERVSIFVDGSYSFSLSLDELAANRVANGQELAEPQLKRLKKISADGKARQRALEWVLNRPRSVREFNDYLKRKKTDAGLAGSLEEEFRQKGYLDDLKFAWWFLDLKRRKNKSARAIRSELIKKGITGEVIDRVLKKNTSADKEALREIIGKKKRQSRYRDPVKLTRYLTSQGFDYSSIKEELSKTDLDG